MQTIINYFTQHAWIGFVMVFVALVVLPWFVFSIQTKEQKKKNEDQAKKIGIYVFMAYVLIYLLNHFLHKK